MPFVPVEESLLIPLLSAFTVSTSRSRVRLQAKAFVVFRSLKNLAVFDLKPHWSVCEGRLLLKKCMYLC
jgi:hypothetical protein